MSVALLALPWLWPLTFGPLASFLPYLVSVCGAAMALMWLLRDGGALALVGKGWLAAALISSVIALLQYFDLEGPLHPWINGAEPGIAFGNLRQPNQLATLLVIGLLSLRCVWQQGNFQGRWGRAGSAGGWYAAALLVVGLAASASRIGLVELLVLGALAVLWPRAPVGERRKMLLLVLGTVAAYAVAALVLPQLLQLGEGVAGRNMIDRLQHGESTCGSRLILWSNVLDLIRAKPWTGWGWGELAYAHYIHLYDGPRFCHILDNAHNLPLHLAVELGVPVAVLVCSAIAYLVWRGRPWAETDPTRQLAWGVLLAIGLHSLVEYPLWYGPFQIAVGLCLWMLWPSSARSVGARSYEKSSALRFSGSAVSRAVATVMLLAVAYTGWDYHRISQIYLPYEQRSAWYRDDAMEYAKRSWLFADVVRFAEVTTRPATRENAPWMLMESLRALHFSPEPRVITKVIESATLLRREDLAMAHLARFKAAFPADYQKWSDENRKIAEGANELLRDAASAASAAPG